MIRCIGPVWPGDTTHINIGGKSCEIVDGAYAERFYFLAFEDQSGAGKDYVIPVPVERGMDERHVAAVFMAQWRSMFRAAWRLGREDIMAAMEDTDAVMARDGRAYPVLTPPRPPRFHPESRD